MVPRCQKCNADRRKVIIVRNGVGHVTDLELDVSGALSQCPSGDPAQQVQSSSTQNALKFRNAQNCDFVDSVLRPVED